MLVGGKQLRDTSFAIVLLNCGPASLAVLEMGLLIVGEPDASNDDWATTVDPESVLFLHFGDSISKSSEKLLVDLSIFGARAT